MRRPRILVPGLPHHVILRGNNRRRLFSYPQDYHQFARYLGDAMVKHAVVMHALVCMTNHVHLLMTPETLDGIPKMVHMASMRYAQYRNRRHYDTGKLYEGRFVSFPVLGEAQLARVTAYIELNPVRAGMRHDPGAYPYSTFGLHTATAGPQSFAAHLWTPSDWFLSLGHFADERAPIYRQWVDDVNELGLEPERGALIRELEAISNVGTDRRIRRPNGLRAT
jgi:putative transposase